MTAHMVARMKRSRSEVSGKVLFFFDGHAAVENTLVGPEQIAGGENDAGSGPGGVLPAIVGCEAEASGIRAQKDQVFPDEAIEHRQAKRREHREQEERREPRHWSGEATVLGDFEGVASVVEHADEQEERAGGDAVREHLVDGPLHGDGVEREDAEDDEAEVADGGVGDELFEVGLDESDESAIDDTDDGENSYVRRGFARGSGKKAASRNASCP
jgi:hypothetical protein